jgi:hypothetical protein
MGGPCVGVLRPAGSFARYANPHGPLSQIGVWGAVNGLQREIIMSTITNQLGTVSFQGRNLTVITTESGEHLVAMKPICEAIGLGWQSQYNRIRRHPVLSTSVFVMNTQIPGDDQQREITCLPLDLLNGWLFGIDASRVKPEIRDRVIQYQRECFHVLAAYWQQGQATNPRKTQPKALPNGLTTDQQASIKALVKARVEVMPKDKQAKAAITCWSALKSKFGCTYKEINPERFTEAVSLVARVSLEGEFIARAEPGEVTLTDSECQQLFLLSERMRHMISHLEDIEAMNSLLKSRTLLSVGSQIREGRVQMRMLANTRNRLEARYRKLLEM